MKQLLAVLLALLAATDCAAQSTTFDPSTGVVDIPCADIWDSRQVVGVYAPFKARMRRVGSSAQFTLEHLQPTTFDTECHGSFDIATRIYSDTVNIGDESYAVKLRNGDGNSFTLESSTLRGPARTSLWVARHGTNTVYLAGTIHLLRNTDYPLPRAYDDAYAKAAALWFEIDYADPNETGDNMTAERFDEIMRDPQGKKLSEQLTPVTYGLLRDYLANTWNLAVASVDHWAAQTLVNTYLHRQLRTIHGVSAHGVDRYLAGRAIADGKPVAGLETMASHYEILHKMDEGFDERTVDSFLYAILSGGDLLSFEQFVGLWRRGDTTELARRSQMMHDDDHDDYLLLYANRNNAWIPQIEAMLRTPETEMVVVGVSHMAGPDGLVAQLRRRGYRVEQY